MKFDNPMLTKLIQPGVLIAFAILTLCLFFLWRQLNVNKPSNSKRHRPGLPTAAPERSPFAANKSGGLRSQDNNILNRNQEKRKQEAIMLVNAEDFIEAARIFEEINMQREAIEILEKNGYLDEAAVILMKINRPNRAAVIYERNKNFARATAYYLRAKMLDDAKRCFEKIEKFDFGLSSELALLFAEAGDKGEAFRILATINDRARILKIARDTGAFTELATFLDNKANRTLLLDSIALTDLEKILDNMSVEKSHHLQRILLLINEGNRGDFLIPTIKYIGNRRDVAQKMMEQVNAEVLGNFTILVQSLEPEVVAKYTKAMDWCARALHDAKHWQTAAITYEKLGSQVMAGKCWALSGQVEKALSALRANPGDAQLLQSYTAALSKLNIHPTGPHDRNSQESESLAHIFHNVDPDVEENRVNSPFSIAS